MAAALSCFVISADQKSACRPGPELLHLHSRKPLQEQHFSFLRRQEGKMEPLQLKHVSVSVRLRVITRVASVEHIGETIQRLIYWAPSKPLH